MRSSIHAALVGAALLVAGSGVVVAGCSDPAQPAAPQPAPARPTTPSATETSAAPSPAEQTQPPAAQPLATERETPVVQPAPPPADPPPKPKPPEVAPEQPAVPTETEPAQVPPDDSGPEIPSPPPPPEPTPEPVPPQPPPPPPEPEPEPEPEPGPSPGTGHVGPGEARAPDLGPFPSRGWSDSFVGSDTCKKCHFKEHRAWRKVTMAKSLETLRPTSSDDARVREVKSKFGLDPDRDYSRDRKCTPCHTTGFGMPGGFPSDSAADIPSGTDSVGCESCHGPGGRYVAAKVDALAADKNAKFTFEQLSALGLVKPTEAVCARCHNEGSPTRAAGAPVPAADPDSAHPSKRR